MFHDSFKQRQTRTHKRFSTLKPAGFCSAQSAADDLAHECWRASEQTVQHVARAAGMTSEVAVIRHLQRGKGEVILIHIMACGLSPR